MPLPSPLGCRCPKGWSREGTPYGGSLTPEVRMGSSGEAISGTPRTAPSAELWGHPVQTEASPGSVPVGCLEQGPEPEPLSGCRAPSDPSSPEDSTPQEGDHSSRATKPESGQALLRTKPSLDWSYPLSAVLTPSVSPHAPWPLDLRPLTVSEAKI